MKIAIYGKKTEGKKREKRLRNYFVAMNCDVQMDMYDNITELIEHIQEYDSICMTNEAVDLITGDYSNRVMFEWGKKVRTCNVNDIYYVEADLKNVHLWFEKGELLVHLPFNRVEQILLVGDFVKTHRSFLVNCQYIDRIDEHVVTLKDGRRIPLSKYRSKEVRKVFADYMQKK